MNFNQFSVTEVSSSTVSPNSEGQLEETDKEL